MERVQILIPTYKRKTGLAVTLTSLCFQTYKNFDIIISDQNEENVFSHPSIQTSLRLLKIKGHNIRLFKHLPRKGMAEQRNFLLQKSNSAFCLFLDDDLILEPFVIGGMVRALAEEKCGFVSRAVICPSYIKNHHPNEEKIEIWNERVKPEQISVGSKKWQRYKLHNAANLFHFEKKFNTNPEKQIKYKIAWSGGCVMFDSEKLKSVGGFSFWKELPKDHVGEDVWAQLKVMEKYGGCGLLPSGVYHQELETTLKKRGINAPDFFESSQFPNHFNKTLEISRKPFF